MRPILYKTIKLISFILLSVSATAEAIEVSGYVILQPTVTVGSSDTVEKPTLRGLGNINRVNMNNEVSENHFWELGLEATQAHVLSDQEIQSPQSDRFRRWKLYREYVEAYENDPGGYYGSFYIDRLALASDFGPVSTTLGRQQISFGAGKFFRPLDVFAPLNFTKITPEERGGVDAIRMRIPTSELGEFDVGVVLGEEEEATFISFSHSQFGIDLQVMHQTFFEASRVGINLVASIGGSNVWVEGARTEPNQDYRYNQINSGIEYQFGDLYTALEYHLNDAGEVDTRSYFKNFSKFAYLQGGTYYVATRYLGAVFSYPATALIGVSGNVLMNTDDGSWFVSSAMNWSLGDEQVVGVIYSRGIGDEDSEFRNYGQILTGQYKYFF